jgi:hypothetical protein
VAHLFTDRGYQARRGDSQSRGAREADVEDTGFWVEVKRGKRCPIRRGIAQMEGDTDGRPTLLFWRDDRGPWRVDMSACTFFEMLASCGPGQWVVPYDATNPEGHDGYDEDND